MIILKRLVLIFILLFFTACNNKSNSMQEIQSASLENTLSSKRNIDIKLLSFYQQWKGVIYKYGGESKKGIDCSALTQRIYREIFNINIPRTTILQSKLGKTINKSHIKNGDLVFFKTGLKSKHVGIYLKKGMFLHASTSKGVTISRLDNTYFSKHFWKVKRVIN